MSDSDLETATGSSSRVIAAAIAGSAATSKEYFQQAAATASKPKSVLKTPSKSTEQVASSLSSL